MKRSYFFGVVALTVFCLLTIPFYIWQKNDQEKVSYEQVSTSPFSPYTSYISAVGIVEASGGNILIGSPVNRLVDKIEVKVGQKVKEGDILFRLESKDLEAGLAARYIDYENAQAKLKKLEELPREEDLSVARAKLKLAKVELNQTKNQYERVSGLQNSGALSQEEVDRRRFAFEQAQAKYQEAEAEMQRTEAGTWKPDLEIARLQVKQAKALVERTEADVERTVIRSPMDATVLQIKIHEGEYPPADSVRNPPMIIGNTNTLNLRVSINQYDASYFNSESPAVAYLQGNSQIEFKLKFMHLEPFLVTKQNLTNDITEKVDTRVLHAIYCFEEGENRIFVGQLMDVFIETFYPAVQ